MQKKKLKPGFDPIWKSDFIDLRSISKSAFILRQIYRLYRDPETNLIDISDHTLNAITGWHLRTIKKARLQLIALNEITPKAYHVYQVKPFYQYKSMAENAIPEESNNSIKCHTSMAENAIQNSIKCHTGMAQNATPYNTTDNTDKDITDTIFKDFVCKDCQTYEPEHLDSKGNKAGYCPVLLVSLPPFTNAETCEHKKPIPAESESLV